MAQNNLPPISGNCLGKCGEQWTNSFVLGFSISTFRPFLAISDQNKANQNGKNFGLKTHYEGMAAKVSELKIIDDITSSIWKNKLSRTKVLRIQLINNIFINVRRNSDYIGSHLLYPSITQKLRSRYIQSCQIQTMLCSTILIKF